MISVVWVYKANILKHWSCKPEIEVILYTMTPWIMLITPILVIVSLVCVILQHQHLLMALLALEVIVLSIIFLIILVIGSNWLIFVIIILTFGACEASLGLACMTAMRRSYGNDHINSLLLNKC